MKKLSRQLFVYALTISTSGIAFAQTDDFVYVPTLEDAMTGSVGALYLIPSSDFESYFAIPSGTPTEANFDVLNVNPGYQFGIDASLGYIFDKTANGVDLFFRNISTSDNDTTEFDADNPDTTLASVTGDLGYDLTAFDFMFSQYVELGRFMEMRLMAGLAYVEVKQNRNSDVDNDAGSSFTFSDQTSKYTGWGPRLGVDSRYDFFGGFGFVAGASAAYYLGTLDTTTQLSTPMLTPASKNATDTKDNQAVMNIRANLAVDLVFVYDDRDNSTMGLELGYLIDYYDDAIGVESIQAIGSAGTAGEPLTTSAASFSGPYLNLKGEF